MRIDKEKFPALFDDNIVLKKFIAELEGEVIKTYGNMIKDAKKNLFYVASTIMDHISDSFPKLAKFWEEIPSTIRGLLFVSQGKPHCLLYFVENLEDRTLIMGQYSAMYGQDHIGDLFAGYIPKGTGEIQFHSYEYVASSASSVGDITAVITKIILATELFINYAEIEKKEVQPSRQIWEGPTCLYNNKTKSPITVIDSTWFTHLVSSGAFKVSGHYRLQPYGHGLTKKKLIWINDFEKTGYTRKAKIESNRNDIPGESTETPIG